MTERELLREQWRAVASALSVEFVGPFYLPLPDGGQWEFAGLLPQFGDVRGMLIDVEHSPEAFSAATAAGFGCSSMLAETRHLPIDPENYIDCLIDWVWSAKEQPAPGWYESAV